MNQTKLDIAAPVIERKCQFGTCEGTLAYVVNGVDLCFAHGREQVSALASLLNPAATTVRTGEQFELRTDGVKP